MGIEINIDGSLFTFPDGWDIEKLDEWSEQKRLTRPPFQSIGCDFVALKEGEIWLVEVKDYSFPGATVASDLAEIVGLKVFHSLAILHAVAHWGTGKHQRFSRKALNATSATVCLAIELPDKGRKQIALATPITYLKEELRKVARLMGANRPVVSNSYVNVTVPWDIRRDPKTRRSHADR